MSMITEMIIEFINTYDPNLAALILVGFVAAVGSVAWPEKRR